MKVLRGEGGWGGGVTPDLGSWNFVRREIGEVESSCGIVWLSRNQDRPGNVLSSGNPFNRREFEYAF